MRRNRNGFDSKIHVKKKKYYKRLYRFICLFNMLYIFLFFKFCFYVLAVSCFCAVPLFIVFRRRFWPHPGHHVLVLIEIWIRIIFVLYIVVILCSRSLI